MESKHGGYGVSFVGFTPGLVKEPFVYGLPPVNEMVLMTTKDKRAVDATANVVSFFDMINIRHEIMEVKDVYDFFEIYFIFESVIIRKGIPEWVNISAGPSSAIAALSMSATVHNISLVSYDSEQNRVLVTDANKIRELKVRQRRDMIIIKELYEGEKTLDELSNKMDLSKSAISRRLKGLRELKMVKARGTGRGNSKLFFELTPFGNLIKESGNLNH